ncbi:hypothetical protein [Flectobacillus major]|uniref:hypothetical protein n=1 Tax=Flectobacillus major TaxID=103 RepID=UPI0004000216|nr:hypothetical protein [Flectobacillus major]
MKDISRTRIVFIAIILLPLWLWLAWFFTPKRKMVVATVDKTVLTSEGQEHISLTWILKHLKFTKTSTKLYQIEDYFGFFPQKDQHYQVKGLERFTDSQLEQLSTDADMAFFTDTYGIYRQEWFAGKSQTERSGILYGGMSEQDLFLLRKMKEKHKLVMMEFNDINSPTSPNIRRGFENDFGMQWTGWIGRYFDSLDTTVNVELPRWLVRNYIKQHGSWKFNKSGIAFVSDTDQVVVLENETHLDTEVPFMVCNKEGQEYYGLPQNIKYPYWFDILRYDPKVNRPLAFHEIYTNNAGKKELQKYGIPSRFPAILIHRDNDYEFTYFAGDFSDNPIGMLSTYFKWIEYIAPWFVQDQAISDRNDFFWEVYQPMTSKILNDYYQKVKKR